MLAVLAVLAVLCAVLYFTDASAAPKSDVPVTTFKGKGAEYWHWRYKVEKKQKHAAFTMIQTLLKQQQQSKKVWRRDVAYAIALASSAFRVSAAEMWAVARCETGGTYSPYAKNSSSTASGLFQFLDSTWASQGMEGFSVFDPVANALATARIVRRQGWRQWVCKP